MDAYFPVHLPYGLSPLHRYCQATGQGVALPYKSPGSEESSRFYTPTPEELRIWYNPDLRPLHQPGYFEDFKHFDWGRRARAIGEEIGESLAMIMKQEEKGEDEWRVGREGQGKVKMEGPEVLVLSSDEEEGVPIHQEKRRKTSKRSRQESSRPSTRSPSTQRRASMKHPNIFPRSRVRYSMEGCVPKSVTMNAFRRASTNEFGFHVRKQGPYDKSQRSQTRASKASLKVDQRGSTQKETRKGVSKRRRAEPEKRRAESEESTDSIIFVEERNVPCHPDKSIKAVPGLSASAIPASIPLPKPLNGANRPHGHISSKSVMVKFDPNFTLDNIPDFDMRRKVSRLRAVTPDSTVQELYGLLIQHAGSYESALAEVTRLVQGSLSNIRATPPNPSIQDCSTRSTPSNCNIRTSLISFTPKSRDDETKIWVKFEQSFFYDSDNGDQSPSPLKTQAARKTSNGKTSKNARPLGSPPITKTKAQKTAQAKGVPRANASCSPQQLQQPQPWPPYRLSLPIANTGKKRSLTTQQRQYRDLEGFVIPDEYPMEDPDGDFIVHGTSLSVSSEEWEV